jgi:hypothetical protein
MKICERCKEEMPDDVPGCLLHPDAPVIVTDWNEGKCWRIEGPVRLTRIGRLALITHGAKPEDIDKDP